MLQLQGVKYDLTLMPHCSNLPLLPSPAYQTTMLSQSSSRPDSCPIITCSHSKEKHTCRSLNQLRLHSMPLHIVQPMPGRTSYISFHCLAKSGSNSYNPRHGLGILGLVSTLGPQVQGLPKWQDRTRTPQPQRP